jgi:hypothetical protein
MVIDVNVVVIHDDRVTDAPAMPPAGVAKEEPERDARPVVVPRMA